MSLAMGLLGNILLDTLTVTSLETDYASEYAEHARYQAKPLLQPTGEALDEKRLTLELHAETGNPQSRLDDLQTLRKSQKAAAFVQGGRYQGWFVITTLGVVEKWTTADGLILRMTVSLTLKEWAGDIVQVMQALAVLQPNAPISAQITPPSQSIGSQVSPAKLSLSETVAALMQSETQAIAAEAKFSALSTLPPEAQSSFVSSMMPMLNNLESAVTRGMNAATTLSGYYSSVTSSIAMVQNGVNMVRQAKTLLSPPINLSTISANVNQVQGNLAAIGQIASAARDPLTALTAQLSLRVAS